MKKFKKIMAVLVAAMMIMATMVPAWAANPDYANLPVGATSGSLELDSYAKITIANPKAGEKYDVYRLFELASFVDYNPATGEHTADTEWYSYVIKDDGSANSWFKFLTTYGPDGLVSAGSKPYAVSDKAGTANQGTAYFLYSDQKVTVNGEANYRIIKGTSNFTNALDDLNTANTRESDNGGGVAEGGDYTTSNNWIVQKFAQEALKYATEKLSSTNLYGNESNGTANLVLVATTDEEPIGYYLVGSTMGTLAALDTTNTEVTIFEKNDEPKIEKYVEDKTVADQWQKNTDADINDKVHFKVIITAEQGVKNYTLHDIMEKGLTFVNTAWTNDTDTPYGYKVVLERDGGTLETPVVNKYTIFAKPTSVDVVGFDEKQTAENYKLDAADAGGYRTDGCDFEISFKDADLADYGNDKVTFLALNQTTSKYEYVDIKDNDRIVVTYYAILNSDATIFGVNESRTAGADTTIANIPSAYQVPRDYNTNQRNDNYAILTYGAKSCTTRETAQVTTYQFDIVKTKDDYNDTNKNYSMLDTATFKVYKVKSSNKEAPDWTIGTSKYEKVNASALHFTKSTDTYTYLGDADTSNGTDTLTSSLTGEMNLRGLEIGTYLIEEQTAPLGYDKLAKPIVVSITDRTENVNMAAETNEGTINISVLNNDSSTTIASQTMTNRNWNATTADGKYDVSTSNIGGIQIINRTSTELPSTGGMGTTVLYIVGGMLVILAGAYLFFSRKRTA